MPPRRATRAASSSRLFDGSSEAGGPLAVAVDAHTSAARGMSPGPAKYSSAYGSPPTMVPTRQNVARQKYNFTTALSHVVSTVAADNESDARAREARQAERQDRQDRQRQTTTTTTTTTTAQQPREPEHEPSSSPMVPPRTRKKREPAKDYTAEEDIFAEAEIFTPAVSAAAPSASPGTGIIARTSSMLQSILQKSGHKAKGDGAADAPDPDAAVQQAYPELNFIGTQPGPADASAPAPGIITAALAPTPAPAPTPTPAPRRKRTTTNTSSALKPASSHIATPGPKGRARRTVSRAVVVPEPSVDAVADADAADELAMDQNDGAATPPPSPGPTTSRQRTKRSVPRVVVEEVEPEVAAQPAPKPAPSAQEPAQPAQSAQPAAKKPAPTAQNPEPEAQPTAQLHAEEQARKAWDAQPPQYVCADGGRLSGISRAIQLLAMALTAVVLGAVALRVLVISTAPDALYQGARVDNRLHWYGSDWRSNLRQFVPYALLHPLGALSDDEFSSMNDVLQSHANAVARLRHTERLHGDALEQIRRILPAVVHMELDKQGRPVIAQEFWHALRDHIQADRDIFTLITGRDGALGISDLQWTALKRQLEGSGLLPDPSVKALSTRDVETVVETTLSRTWEEWLRRNQDKVRRVLGLREQQQQPQSEAEQPLPSAGEMMAHLSDTELGQLAQNMAASKQAREVLLPRQEFLQMLQNAFVEHRLEIKGELAALEARVLDVARAAGEAVKTPAAPSPSADMMSKKDIATLVDQLVRKSISHAQLEAMARGSIVANWRSALVHQVNFFGGHSGAVVNRHLTSPAYAPQKASVWAPGAAGGRTRAPGSLQAAVALQGWEEDGDCWCGVHDGGGVGSGSGSGTQLGIRLGLRVLPQYLVVEHITPSATLDPGAMPKDLELWAQVTDYAAQRPLMDWSLHQFPGTDAADALFGWGFVKIGAFRYERGGVDGDPKKGETQVFRLSPDLATLDAATDHVVVRARTNHGGVDHTCLYRVRLYGEAREE